MTDHFDKQAFIDGRSVKSFLEYATDNEGFLYVSEEKEKVRQLLARNGLQLSAPLKLSNSNINVAQNNKDVNNHSMQKGKINSAVKESFEKALNAKKTPGARNLMLP